MTDIQIKQLVGFLALIFGPFLVIFFISFMYELFRFERHAKEFKVAEDKWSEANPIPYYVPMWSGGDDLWFTYKTEEEGHTFDVGFLDREAAERYSAAKQREVAKYHKKKEEERRQREELKRRLSEKIRGFFGLAKSGNIE